MSQRRSNLSSTTPNSISRRRSDLFSTTYNNSMLHRRPDLSSTTYDSMLRRRSDLSSTTHTDSSTTHNTDRIRKRCSLMVMRSCSYLPEEVIEVVLGYLTSNKDRNAASLVCKCWYNVERLSRRKVIVGNCHAISPERVMARFPNLTSLTLKGKPRSFHSDFYHHEWAGSVQPWIETIVSSGVKNFEELRLKRMVVTNQSFLLLSQSFPDSFTSLVLISCQTASGTTSRLDPIVSNCRSLRELHFQESAGGKFCFLDSCTTLVSLNFSDLAGDVPIESLERLVARCPNLKSLRLNSSVSANVLPRVLAKAPQLVDLGVGSFAGVFPATYNTLNDALRKCTLIRSLSGFYSWMDVRALTAIYPICHNLTSLKFHPAGIKWHGSIIPSNLPINRLIRRCIKLECLWVKGSLITDEELRVLASTCKELQEFRIIEGRWIPDKNLRITEQGLVALSAGCPKLKKLKFICKEISNEALITVAENCPNLVSFMLHTTWEDVGRRVEDVMAMQPLDEGFGAIVQLCKGLKRLRLCGRLTDQVFFYIGMYAEQLEVLTVDLVKLSSVMTNGILFDYQVRHFAGDSKKGILYVLNGCKKLKVLDIRNSSFGNTTLLDDVSKYERIRCLYTENCQVTLGACKQLVQEMPSLNVEIITRKKLIMRPPGNNIVSINPGDNDKIHKMYLYRTLVGPRKDAPDSVRTL